MHFFSYGADCRIIMHYAWMNWKEPTKHDSLSKNLYMSSLSSYVLRCEENWKKSPEKNPELEPKWYLVCAFSVVWV